MIPAVLLSLASGVTVVVGRTLNADLSGKTSPLYSTFYNYVVGLSVALAVTLLAGGFRPVSFVLAPNRLWIYTGGLLGCLIVVISNLTVSKISAFAMTLLLFVGQVFTGILLDAAISKSFAPNIVAGGFFVAAGLIINTLVDRQDATKKQSDQAKL